MKKGLFIAALLVAATTQSFADSFNNIWVKAVVVPEGAGTVYVDWAIPDDESKMTFGATSEFKRSNNLAPSTGFIWAEANAGWQLAGFAHDNNKNGQFDNDVTLDKQIWRRSTGLFTAIYDPTEYTGQTTEAMQAAENALAQMASPTDLVFAVFTKGTIATQLEDQEHMGKVWISKLNNAAGDQLTLEAYGDSWYNSATGKNLYFKFGKWTKKGDSSFSSTDRILNVTAEEGAAYYANFVKIAKEEFDANERGRDPHKEDYQSSGEISGIQNVKTGNTASTAVYDLLGRRVAQPAKGLYIQNGKKFVKK